MAAPQSERVAILDAGSQFGKLIDRRVRDLCVESDLLPFSTPATLLSSYKCVILSGGPESVSSPSAPSYDPAIFRAGLPVLGICYGFQLINSVFGGTVRRLEQREDGQYQIRVAAGSELFRGLPETQRVLLTHGDSVVQVADGFAVTAVSSNGVVAALEDPGRRVFGVQFHPEVDLTEHGPAILRNFLFGVAGLRGLYTPESRMERAVRYIVERAGEAHVLVLVSGGVDSTVCAALLRRALPPHRIHAVHVDSGFMRAGESRAVENALNAIGLEVTAVDAAEQFRTARTTIDGRLSEALCEAVAPETKRKIIGDTFMAVFDAAVRRLGLAPDSVVLAQGTLRPDLIESASETVSGAADVIKTHHNDTNMVRALRRAGRVLEPLHEYHKDQVRQLGLELGLPEQLVWRQPFPGPGLAIRIICCDGPYVPPDAEATLAVLRAETAAHPDVCATLLPCRTVGVQGDARTYSALVGLTSRGPPPWDRLLELARDIPRRAHGVNRVVYVWGPPVEEAQLLDVAPTRLSPEVVAQARAADAAVTAVLERHHLLRTLSQVPVVLFPASFGQPGARSVCIRTFITSDFMTGVPAVPGKDVSSQALQQMVDAVRRVPGVARVCFDLTAKPPATTEWE